MLLSAVLIALLLPIAWRLRHREGKCITLLLGQIIHFAVLFVFLLPSPDIPSIFGERKETRIVGP